MKTLEQILAKEKEHRHEEGDFGIKACKESIKFEVEWRRKRNEGLSEFTVLLELLGEYYIRGVSDVFFNKAMILACWELINEVQVC